MLLCLKLGKRKEKEGRKYWWGKKKFSCHLPYWRKECLSYFRSDSEWEFLSVWSWSISLKENWSKYYYLRSDMVIRGCYLCVSVYCCNRIPETGSILVHRSGGWASKGIALESSQLLVRASCCFNSWWKVGQVSSFHTEKRGWTPTTVNPFHKKSSNAYHEGCSPVTLMPPTGPRFPMLPHWGIKFPAPEIWGHTSIIALCLWYKI
jgi:hypothetical protein